MASDIPATSVTVTLPADWRDQLAEVFRPGWTTNFRKAMELVESWAAPVVSGDVESDTAKLSDSLKLAIAAADRRQARIDAALALVDQYLTGDWPNSGVKALFIAALTNDPAVRSVPVDPETCDECVPTTSIVHHGHGVPWPSVDPETTQPARGVRCCIGPFADGTHTQNCRDRCQDCGGDEAGPRRCRCRDTGPAGATQDGDQT